MYIERLIVKGYKILEELQIPSFIQNGHSERDGQRSP